MAELPDATLSDLYRRVKSLRLRVLRDVTSRLAGSYASAFRGPGVEFLEHRRYAAGDDVRHIDWLLTARRQEPYVRRYVEERELRVLLALDVSGSMGDAGRDGTRRQTACLVAAAVALSAAWKGDRVGGLLFGQRVQAALRAARGERHALSVVQRCLGEPPRGDRTDLRPVLKRLRNVRGHALVFLLSDFLTRPAVHAEDVRRLLAACACKHDLMAVWLREGNTAAEGAVAEVADPESGVLTHLDLRGAAGRRTREALADERRRTRRAFGQCGVPVIELRTGQDYVGELLRLFAGRGSRKRR
ncbi:MAG: hypothetical protein AMK73_08365 [Planctomycetes bacterium SM23_32]|nr:MAG: hypothetical protein AMK73_08365 [Planctomycetes bacterium SM23_32]